MLFLNQVRSNRLNLGRRTAMKGGNGYAVDDFGLNRLNIFLGYLLKTVKVCKKPSPTLLKDFGVLGILHLVDETVYLGKLDSFQIISYGNVKLESIGIS